MIFADMPMLSGPDNTALMTPYPSALSRRWVPWQRYCRCWVISRLWARIIEFHRPNVGLILVYVTQWKTPLQDKAGLTDEQRSAHPRFIDLCGQ